MIYYVLMSPLLPLIVLVFSFVVVRLLTKNIRVNEFDAIAQLNLNTAFSLSSLTALGVLGYVESDDLLTIYSLYLLFYLVVWITSMVIGDRQLQNQKKIGFDPRLFSDPRYQYIVATVTGLIVALSSLFFAYILVSQGLSGDDRIALAKDYRVMDIVRRGFATIFTYYSISCFLYRRDKYLMGLLIFNIFIAFFSGSKSFVAEYLTAYITIKTLIEGTGRTNLKKYFPIIAFVLLFTIGAVMFWQGASFTAAVESMSNRLFASGDIFYYAFIHNDYRTLFGEYNFWSYVFHPFTSLIGIRGYEWPIGSLLYVQPGMEIKGFGPNPQLPMTALILLNGNIWLSALFCSFMAMLLVLANNFALRLLQVRSLPTVLRTSVFAVLFVKSSVILVDFSLVVIDLISVLAMTAATLGFQAVLDRRDLIAARRMEKMQALIGQKKAGPSKPEQREEEIPLPAQPTRSKKTEQFEEFVSTTIFHKERLKRLAELLNITTKFK
jgi:hypothetical protein